mmetsp:Transcript_39014/g.101642  ORF Transcript_39014/g.101642 Transcript_39014/m.101642 type:complete len:219 (-) Transcript_39014:157-813(-)
MQVPALQGEVPPHGVRLVPQEPGSGDRGIVLRVRVGRSSHPVHQRQVADHVQVVHDEEQHERVLEGLVLGEVHDAPAAQQAVVQPLLQQVTAHEDQHHRQCQRGEDQQVRLRVLAQASLGPRCELHAASTDVAGEQFVLVCLQAEKHCQYQKHVVSTRAADVDQKPDDGAVGVPLWLWRPIAGKCGQGSDCRVRQALALLNHLRPPAPTGRRAGTPGL